MAFSLSGLIGSALGPVANAVITGVTTATNVATAINSAPAIINNAVQSIAHSLVPPPSIQKPTAQIQATPPPFTIANLQQASIPLSGVAFSPIVPRSTVTTSTQPSFTTTTQNNFLTPSPQFSPAPPSNFSPLPVPALQTTTGPLPLGNPSYTSVATSQTSDTLLGSPQPINTFSPQQPTMPVTMGSLVSSLAGSATTKGLIADVAGLASATLGNTPEGLLAKGAIAGLGALGVQKVVGGLLGGKKKRGSASSRHRTTIRSRTLRRTARPAHMIKGSAAAKRHMAKLRRMRKK